MEWFIDINAYHWFALGLLLFAAEALGAAGFLLGAAAAALVLGFLTLFVPEMAISAQLGLYAIVALTATALYLKAFRQEQDDQGESGLNRRAASLIGHEFDLHDALPGGTSRIQIGDTLWRVEANEALHRGTRVKVVSADEMSLRLATAE